MNNIGVAVGLSRYHRSVRRRKPYGYHFISIERKKWRKYENQRPGGLSAAGGARGSGIVA
jgi:hypothetical protein